MKNTFQKKMITILVLVAFTGTLTGCSLHSHKYTEATCTEPSVCSVCGEEKDAPLGHTCNIGICERCDEALGADILNDYVYKSKFAVTASGRVLEFYNENRYMSETYCQLFHESIGDVITLCEPYAELDEIRLALEKMYAATEDHSQATIDGIADAMSEVTLADNKLWRNLPSRIRENVNK